MNYQTIYTIKESEKATVELAAVEMFVGPVIVKKLKGGKAEIYRLLCESDHPNVSQIISVEETEECLMIVEEYVDGENLAEHLQKHYLCDDEKLNLALQLCDAVGFLHALKPSVIHRDIKPSNILITGKGTLKLIDFDASRQYKDTPSSGDTRLMGTVEYAPPEQFGYSQTDVRSDIYSMGVVFHEMRPTENKKLAERWEKISEKCTSFDPKNRYQSVAELKREFEKLAAWKTTRKRKLIAGSCIAAACLLLAAGAGIFLRSKQTPAEATGTPGVAAAPTTEPTETPISDIAAIVTDLSAQSYYIDTFYKGIDTSADFMQYSTYYEGEAMEFNEVAVWNLATGESFFVPQEYYYNENNVLHISRNYIKEWAAGAYRLRLDYADASGSHKGAMETHLLVSDGDTAGEDALLFDNNYLDFYYEYYPYIHLILANDIVGRFKEDETYRLLENGRVIEFGTDFLMQHAEPGTNGKLVLDLELEDGRMQSLTIAYKTGKPPYVK